MAEAGRLGGFQAVTERRESIFDRKLDELNSVISELEALQENLERITGRLLDPRPSPAVETSNKAVPIDGEPTTHEAKLAVLMRRLNFVRARFMETINFLSQAV